MSSNEKDLLEILESLAVTISSIAATVEIISRTIKERRSKKDRDER